MNPFPMLWFLGNPIVPTITPTVAVVTTVVAATELTKMTMGATMLASTMATQTYLNVARMVTSAMTPEG